MPGYRATCRLNGETHTFLLEASNIRSAAKRAKKWFEIIGLRQPGNKGRISIEKVLHTNQVPELQEEVQ